MSSAEFEAGKLAFSEGKSECDNPYICGTTKLGNPKFSDQEAGAEWLAGYISAKPARAATEEELQAAAQVDVSRFRRRSNRHYRQ
jgi:hypothetical protein